MTVMMVGNHQIKGPAGVPIDRERRTARLCARARGPLFLDPVHACMHTRSRQILDRPAALDALLN